MSQNDTHSYRKALQRDSHRPTLPCDNDTEMSLSDTLPELVTKTVAPSDVHYHRLVLSQKCESQSVTEATWMLERDTCTAAKADTCM